MNKFIIEAFNKSQTLAAIFEDDGTTGYLYLYDPNASEGDKIRASMKVYSSTKLRVKKRDVNIIWSNDETKVSVLIRGNVYAVYDLRNFGDILEGTLSRKKTYPETKK